MADQKSTRTPTRIGWVIVLSLAMLAGFAYSCAHGLTWSAAWEWVWEASDSMALGAVKLVLLIWAALNFVLMLPPLLCFSDDEEMRKIIPHLFHEEIEVWEVLLLLLFLPAAVFLAAMHVVHPIAGRFFKWFGRTAERVLTTKVMKRK